MVRKAVSDGLCVVHSCAKDQPQVVELTEKIYHKSTVFLTARE